VGPRADLDTEARGKILSLLPGIEPQLLTELPCSLFPFITFPKFLTETVSIYYENTCFTNRSTMPYYLHKVVSPVFTKSRFAANLRNLTLANNEGRL
jgi:hypothetical protein